MNEILVYIGTYTHKGSKGIYVYRFDAATGALQHSGEIGGVVNPSFLDIHPSGRFLYAVCEVSDMGGKPGGGVAALAIDPKTGSLTMLNQESSVGKGPCHLSVERTGKYVVVANYGGGSVALLPIQPDGRLGPASDFVQHQGSSVNPRRQEGPHAHSIVVDPGNRCAFAPDLGLDKILIYRLDLQHGKLKPNDPPSAQVQGGAGPRHFVFHPSAKFAWVITEIGNTMTGFAHDTTTGRLTEIESLSTLPTDFKGTSYCADVHVTPSGKFLYGSNRGHDSIAIFAVNEATGRLTPVGHESTQGKNPRNFAVDPTGNFLLAANQDTDNVVTFRIDAKTGKLTPTGHVAQVPTPVCLKFLRRKA